MQNTDDGGNHSLNFEDLVGSIVEDEVPVAEEPKVEDSKAEEPEVEVEEDEYDSILDDLAEDDDDEAGDKPEEASNDTEEEAEADDGQETFKYKYNGEEFELTAEEVHALRKDAGRGKALTQKEQDNAETKKALEKETQAVQWAKETPERRDLAQKIADANDAILKGFTFDENGNQVQLTRQQIERTQANVDEAQAQLLEMAKPPRLEELREAIPEVFSQDPAERDKVLKPFGETLAEVGYSQAEIASQNDPRIFFLLKELHEARDVVKRVETAKAKRKDKKPSIASKTTKAAKTVTPSRTSKSSEAKPNTDDIWNKVAKGEASPADLFMD